VIHLYCRVIGHKRRRAAAGCRSNTAQKRVEHRVAYTCIFYIYIDMHISIYIYTYPCIYIYMYTYIYMYICVCAYMHICTYVFLCSFIAIHICTHIYCRAVGYNRGRAAAGYSSEGTQQGIEWSLAAVNSSAHDLGMAVRSLSHPPWILQHTATHCNTLQHTATHCNTLQHTATHCNTVSHPPWYVHHYPCVWENARHRVEWSLNTVLGRLWLVGSLKI